MSRREDLDNGIWANPEFHRLTIAAKLAYIWSWTNPACGMSGLYRLNPGIAAVDLGLDADQEREVFAELERSRFLYYRDGVMFVRSRVAYLRTRTIQMTKSVVRDVESIPEDHPLRELFAAEYAESWLAKAIESFSLDTAVLVRFTRPSPDPTLTTDGDKGLGFVGQNGYESHYVDRTSV